jgi:hypothetical protein
MREILYHRNAVRYLKRMPADRKEQIKTALADVALLPDIQGTPTSNPWPVTGVVATVFASVNTGRFSDWRHAMA